MIYFESVNEDLEAKYKVFGAKCGGTTLFSKSIIMSNLLHTMRSNFNSQPSFKITAEITV